ncbi:DNA primase small subunit [Gryllus bimaculatus]|nr:DNA primase small subunit [Gryllus bimaculatus]
MNSASLKREFIQWRRRERIEKLLFLYYQNLFPYELIYKWLNYGKGHGHFDRREFSFTLVKGAVARFQSFRDCGEWRRALLEEKPAKIDVGALYTLDVKKKTANGFAPCEKELVFDIDITDYDDVRYCCKGASVCQKCWKFLAVACKILDITLREDFGFQHLLWVFSGRRGIHCWVCDDSVRILPIEARCAIINYVQLVIGGVYMPKKVKIAEENIHHSIRRALDIIREYFIIVCIQEQDILGTPRKMAKFLNVIEDEDLKEVQDKFFEHRCSRDRWFAFMEYIKELQDTGNLKRVHKHIVEEIMIQYLYPRLDSNVSKSVNHLLKCPFSVHADTGKIAIPFDPKDVDNFNPLKVPNVELLLNEITELKRESFSTQKDLHSPQNTRLCESLVIFQDFVSNLEKSQEGKKIIPNLVPLQVRY